MTDTYDSAGEELEEVLAAASRQLAGAGLPRPYSGAGFKPAPTGAESPAPDDQPLFCSNHPAVETRLRCNRCGKPICTRCMVRTPVGYRCRECVGQQRAVYYTGGVGDYVLGGLAGLVLGSLACLLMALVRSWFIGLFLGPTIGVGIAEAVRLLVRKRRSRYLWLATGAGMVLGVVPAALLSLLGLGAWALLSLGLFLALAVGAAAARLR